MSSFDAVALIRAMRREFPHEDIYIERTNGNRLVIRENEDVMDVAGYVLVSKETRDVAINPDHIITIFNKGDL